MQETVSTSLSIAILVTRVTWSIEKVERRRACETKTETARKGKEEKRNGWKQPSLCIILIQLQPVQCLHNFCRQRRDENITEWSLTSFQAGERGVCAREGSEGRGLK